MNSGTSWYFKNSGATAAANELSQRLDGSLGRQGIKIFFNGGKVIVVGGGGGCRKRFEAVFTERMAGDGGGRGAVLLAVGVVFEGRGNGA